MGLSRTVSQINGDFSQKVQIFLSPFTLRPAEGGSPWNWISALGIEDYDDGTTGTEIEVEQLNFRRLGTMHEHDRQRRTDRHRATAKTALTNNVAR